MERHRHDGQGVLVDCASRRVDWDAHGFREQVTLEFVSRFPADAGQRLSLALDVPHGRVGACDLTFLGVVKAEVDAKDPVLGRQ